MEYLGEGLSEEITNSLSRLPNLQVMARSTVLRYRSRQDDPQSIGHELRVDAVLTGRVSQHGDELNVETELVNVVTGAQIWGQRYTQAVKDASRLQGAITGEVANQLKQQMTGRERDDLAKAATGDPQAYQLYLKGRFYAEKYTQEGFEKGVEYFHQAINLDPNYAAAYAGLSYAYGVADDLVASPADTGPKAIEAAKKALELDDSLADAHFTMALVDFGYNYDWSAAEREYRRAIELAPRNASVYGYYGWTLGMTGQPEQAVQVSRRGVEVEPLSSEANWLFGGTLLVVRRYDEAVKQLRAAIDLDPAYWFTPYTLGMVYEQQGDLSGALEQFQKANRMVSEVGDTIPWPLAAIGNVSGLMGRKSEAEQALKELTRRSQRGYVPAYAFACVNAGSGKTDQALTFLEKAYADRSMWLAFFVKNDPELDSLRSERRFTDLLLRMGLPQ